MTLPVLSVADLYVEYGASQALFGVSFDVEEGAALAVLGTNGAGKSSLARALSGLVSPKVGSVHLGGRDVTGWPPYRIRRLGLTYLPEGRGVFPGLTVGENLRMAVRWLGSKAEQQVGIERAISLFPVLGGRRQQWAGTLSGGEQQMLSLARGLAVRPRLLIADELSLGLAPMVVDSVFESLEAAREMGISIILIEQFVHRALEFCDRALILRRGSVEWSGETAEANEDVMRTYLV